MLITFYKLFCKKTGKVYAGKTKNTLQERLHNHEYQYKIFVNGGTNNCGSFSIIAEDDYDIIDISTLKFNTDDKNHIDIRIHEQLCIDLMREMYGELCCNIYNAYTNKKEYFKEYNKEYNNKNADKIKERNKEYYNENADKIKENQREYQNKNADKIKEYYNEYCVKNADKIKERKKEHYKKNADKINEKRKLKIICEVCEIEIAKRGLLEHTKSNKHKQNEIKLKKLIGNFIL